MVSKHAPLFYSDETNFSSPVAYTKILLYKMNATLMQVASYQPRSRRVLYAQLTPRNPKTWRPRASKRTAILLSTRQVTDKWNQRRHQKFPRPRSLSPRVSFLAQEVRNHIDSMGMMGSQLAIRLDSLYKVVLRWDEIQENNQNTDNLFFDAGLEKDTDHRHLP